MDAIYASAPQPSTKRLALIMLPGAGDRPRDFVRHGFVRKLHEHGLDIDAIVVDAHLGYYLDRSFVMRLHEDIIAPARAKAYQQIWLMGISLGGAGALLYLRDYPLDVNGIILLGPFLGSRGTIAEITRAGNLKCWQPTEIMPDDDERLLLTWLKDYQFNNPTLPKIYLGYGKGDRFAAGSALIAEQLPVGRVITVDGGHDWVTWLHIWQQLLEQRIFSGAVKTD